MIADDSIVRCDCLEIDVGPNVVARGVFDLMSVSCAVLEGLT